MSSPSTPLTSLDTWTDDLPWDRCLDHGTGFVVNKLYSSSSSVLSLHDYLHKSFGVRLPSGDYLYGLLTGFNSAEAVRYFATHLPLVMSDRACKQSSLVTSSASYEEIFFSNILKDTFRLVEKAFKMENEDQLNEKLILDIRLKEETDLQSNPEAVDKLNQIEKELSSGTSAAVVLIHNSRIFVANVGDTKVLLCRKVLNDHGGFYLRCVELTSQHTLDNAAERKRLQSAGLDLEELEDIGGTRLTRCLGYLLLKSFYKDFFPNANEETLLAEPEVESISIDEGGQFLVLVSDSLLKALMEADPSLKTLDLTQNTLIQWIADELNGDDMQAKLKTAAQTIVDRIAQMHQDCFTNTKKCRQIEDMTLVVRSLQEIANTIAAGNSRSSSIPIIEVDDVSHKLGELKLDIEAAKNENNLEGRGIPVNYETSAQYMMHDLDIGVNYRSNTNDTCDDDRTVVANMTNATGPMTPTNATNDSWTFDSEHHLPTINSINSTMTETGPVVAYVDFEPLWKVLEKKGDQEALARRAKLDEEQRRQQQALQPSCSSSQN